MEHTGDMGSNPFRFNSNAKYQPGPQKAAAHDVPSNLAEGRVQVQSDDPQKWFEAHYPEIFECYRLPSVSSDKLVQAWHSSPMQFWQNQLNFAVWCATAGCGVSLEDHLSAADDLLQSVYRFHVYYQIRRILVEIQAPLPQDQAWEAMNNPYDRRAYERICSEFGVSPHTDWRQHGPNNGLGRVYFYATHVGYLPVYGGLDPNHYDPDKMSFAKKYNATHVDFIRQDAAEAWKTFILPKSEGFTRPGVERLNDSIRTYVWAILGAQAQTRTGILGSGTAFDAQKQFLANVEDAISSPVDLPSAIKRYQDVLMYAGSEVNYVFGTGLYMAPADMALHIGRVTGYNNEIVIATAEQTLGINRGINVANAPPNASGDTGETGLVKPAKQSSAPHGLQRHVSATPLSVPAEHVSETLNHEAEKTALIVGGIAIGLGTLWLVTK